MKKLLFIFLTLLGAISFISASRKETVLSDEEILKITKDLTPLSKVNDKPQLILGQLSVLCAQYIPPSETKTHADSHPHDDKYINVYVTKNGFSEMTTKKSPLFPEGIIIVKEKFNSLADTAKSHGAAELYTIMIKREKGYNPACGDWEFASVDGKTSNLERGKITACMNCHSNYTSTDFISRENYLGKKYTSALR